MRRPDQRLAELRQDQVHLHAAEGRRHAGCRGRARVTTSGRQARCKAARRTIVRMPYAWPVLPAVRPLAAAVLFGCARRDMRERNPRTPCFQVPLMLAFREAFRARRRRQTHRGAGRRRACHLGARLAAAARRRRGAAEARTCRLDLLSLVNTIDLGVCDRISDLDYVERSVAELRAARHHRI